MPKSRGSRSGGIFGWLFLIVMFIIIIVKVVGIDSDKPADKDIDMSDIYSGDSEQLDNSGFYAQLKDTEKKLYNELCETIKSGKLVFEKDNVNYDEYRAAFNNAVNALFFDHPEFFWINGGAKMRCTSSGLGKSNDSLSITMECYDYWSYTDSPDKYIDALNKKVKELSDNANKLSTDYEKVKYVHDYLVTNVEYDHVAADEIKNTVRKASSEQAYSVYGCLVNNKAVCSGYAKAFQLIMKNIGIDCNYIVGDAGGPHGWNSVCLDGQDYYMDVTWDDADDRNEDGSIKYPNDAEYRYFCVTTKELTRNHTVDNEFSAPVCVATENNYFVKENYLIEKYDFNQLAQVIDRQSDLQIKSVKFASYYDCLRAYDDLFGEEKRCWDIDSLDEFKSVKHNIDKNMYVITIKGER